jgi:hypothetical protein
MFSAPAILLTMMAILYLDASWEAPTFSASAGYRAIIEFLPFMAIPLSYLIIRLSQSGNKRIVFISALILIILVLYNIQFAFKYDSTVWWDRAWSYKTMLRLFTL